MKDYFIVRTDRAGVFFGKIKLNKETSIIMTDVRKLHYWVGAAAVEELSQTGANKPAECRFTVTIPEMEIASPIQIIPCTEKAIEVIKSIKEWKA